MYIVQFRVGIIWKYIYLRLSGHHEKAVLVYSLLPSKDQIHNIHNINTSRLHEIVEAP